VIVDCDRPIWAHQGLEFLILTCDPQTTRHLDDKEFENLKSKMDECISHVIGICEPKKITKKKASPRTRKTSSPAPSRSRTTTRTSILAGMTDCKCKILLPQFSLKEENFQANISAESADIPDSSINIVINIVQEST